MTLLPFKYLVLPCPPHPVRHASPTHTQPPGLPGTSAAFPALCQYCPQCCSQYTRLPSSWEEGRADSLQCHQRWMFGPGKHPSLGYAGAGPQPGNRGDVQTGTQASSSHCPAVPPTRCRHRKQFQSTSGQIQGRKMLRDRLRKCTSSGWPPSCTSPGAPREAAGAASPPPASLASCRPPTPSQLLGGRVLPRAPCRFPFALPLPHTCAETAGKQRDPVKATVKLNQERQIKYLTSK